MAVPGAEDVYLTLLLSDSYLPGALVLAHSLRDAGTTKKLGVLVTLDSVGADAVSELQTVYDYVLAVPRIRNPAPANLSLMNRADLHSAFTKINLWKQTQFRKIVYIDADVVAYRAPDELFDLAHAFSAAPDIGWPDLFNSGVMALTPSMGEYYALMAMAERGISFDGADQGLLNMHFKNSHNRLSFTYNVTPSAHYQYIPAYRHFQSSISMVHFIGQDKPWFRGRYASTGSATFDEMLGRWWAVYDRHYRVPSPTTTPSGSHLDLVQYLTKGEYQPRMASGTHGMHVETTGEPRSQHQDAGSHIPDSQGGDVPDSRKAIQSGAMEQQSGHDTHFSSSSPEETEAEAREEQVPQQHGMAPEQKPETREITFSDWDASRHPPPTDAKPEAENFPSKVYEMSRDTTPFVPPERYPSPPQNMWFEVPKERPFTKQTKPIFPWENNQPPATRVFASDSSRSIGIDTVMSNTKPGSSEEKKPVTPDTPTIRVTPSDPWNSFSMTNAWDEVPEIERYVDAMQKQRRKSLKSPGTIEMPERSGAVDGSEWRQHGTKLTDFPTKDERYAVTPAPVGGPKFWGGPSYGGALNDKPSEEVEWDPVAKLQELAKQGQSEELLRKLGSGIEHSSNIPLRPVPSGSEGLVSPTYVARTGKGQKPQPARDQKSRITTSGPAGDVPSDDDATPRAARSPVAGSVITGRMPQPSYTGPGATFEKGEDYPRQGTPFPPSEKERDVLET